MMQFGIFDHLDNDSVNLADYYEGRLRFVEKAERLGFYGYHLAEHHGTTLGMAPSPNVFLASVAQRTKRLRFGPMVYALPLYHKLRLAQEIAMLDQLSRGRLEIGFGRGSSPIEIQHFGIDPSQTETIYRDALPLILEALETGVMRCPELVAPFDQFTMTLKTAQRPHPPVWYGVHVVESAIRAARLGYQTINLDPAGDVRACNEAFIPAWREAHPGRALPLMGLGRFIVVADTDAQANAIARRAYPHWHAGFTHLFTLHGFPQRHPRPETWDKLVAQDRGIAGSPATVTAYLRAQMAQTLCNYCVVQTAFGDQSEAELNRSMDLFAEQVMPALGATSDAQAA